MKIAIQFILCVSLFLSSCGDERSPEKEIYKKGHALNTLPDYQNMKAVADAVKAAVIDSCQYNNILTFEEIVKITPKLYQLIRAGAYKEKTCVFVNEKLGDIKEWNLREAFMSHDHLLKIFRYRLNSAKYDFPLEFRVTLTHQNKLTEYRFYKWEKDYSEDLIKMRWN